LRTARDLKMRLAAIGQPVDDKTLIQLVLIGLPRSFEGIIKTLTSMDNLLTFTALSSKLLSEAHRMEQRQKQLGDDKALVVQFSRFQMRGRGGPPRFAYQGGNPR
jgi:hypothetical protein